MKPLAVVPTYCRRASDIDALRATLRTLRATADVDVLVCDDASPERWQRRVQRAAEKVGADFVAQAENGGFARAVNFGFGVAAADGRDLVLVNADVEFTDNGWLDRMLDTDADVVGALLLYPNGVVQHGGIYFSRVTRTFSHIGHGGSPATPELSGWVRYCPVTAALMLVRRETIKAVGLFDEGYGLGLEDVDYCLRVMQAGLRCAINPSVVATHHESMFRGNGRSTPALVALHERSVRRFAEVWSGVNFAPLVPEL